MTVPYTFANASQSIPLAELDANFESVGVADNIEYTPPFTNAVSETVTAKLSQTISVKDFGAAGDGITDDTVSFSNAITYLNNNGGGTLYIPDGIYMISFLQITAVCKRIIGSSPSAPSLTSGVILRCNSSCTNFVTITGVGHQIQNIYFDGNSLVSNAVMYYTGVTTYGTTSNIVVSGVKSGGSLVQIGSSPSDPVSNWQFSMMVLSGASGVKNLYINSDESLNLSFYDMVSANGDYGVYHTRGSAQYYNPFFTANNVNDYYVNNGSVSIHSGRSESSSNTGSNITSIISSNASSANVTLIDYVHASTITLDSVSIGGSATGKWTFVGGQYSNISISSSLVNVVLNNVINYTGAIIYGSGALYAVNIQSNFVSSPATQLNGGNRFFTASATPSTGTWAKGDIVYNNSPAASGYVGWVCVVSGSPGTWKTFGAISA